MPADLPFVPDRFKSTVPFYTAYRSRYPTALIGEIVSRVRLDERHRVLDLGCGPGYPTVELARFDAGEVIGMDPDPAMLAAAREEAARANVRVSFVQGSSYDLSPDMGVFRLVTMGRSFHWMDRAATLEALDGMIEDGGAVVILSDTLEPAAENRWNRVVREVQDRFVGEVTGGPKHHAVVLLNSAFSRIDSYAIIERNDLTAEAIIGRAFSLLKASPTALGEQMDDFAAELRARLLDLSPSGEFSEVRRFEALFARRPGI